MKTFGNLIASLLIITLLFAIVWGAILGAKHLIAQFQTLETEQAGVLIIVGSFLLIYTLILTIALRFNKNKSDKLVHPEKSYIYSDFLNYYIEIRSNIQNQGHIPYKFRSDMSLWAAHDVLKAYIKFNQLIVELSPDHPKILNQAEKVIFEMRKDLGLRNYGLGSGDLDGIIFPGIPQPVKSKS